MIKFIIHSDDDEFDNDELIELVDEKGYEPWLAVRISLSERKYLTILLKTNA